MSFARRSPRARRRRNLRPAQAGARSTTVLQPEPAERQHSLNERLRARTIRAPFGPIGVCAYIAGAGVSLALDLPLLFLVVCAAIAGLQTRTAPSRPVPLALPVLAFLGLTAVSIGLSAQPGQSLRVMASLLPAALVFFVVASLFPAVRHVWSMFLTFAIVSTGLSMLLLWNAWLDGPVSPNIWALHAATPFLVVGNDVTFLAVIAPLSLVLTGHRRTGVRLVGGLSLALSAGIVVLFESRGALVVMAVSLACAGALLRPRGLARAGVAVAMIVCVVDASLGFPLAGKFGLLWSEGLWDARLGIWRAAWQSFREAPWLGHGPYTAMYVSSDGRESMRWAHNLYLDVLAGQGLAGLGALGVLLAAALLLALRTHGAADGDVRRLNAAALGSLVGFCVAAVFEVSLIRLWATTTLFTVLGVIARLSAEDVGDRRTTCVRAAA